MTPSAASALNSDRSEPADAGDRPVSEILKDLMEHTQTLAKQELSLAGAELDQKLSKAKAELLAPLLGIAVMYTGLLAIIASLALLLARAIDPWLATLIVGLITGGIGYALFKARTSATDLEFERSSKSIRADVQTIKEATK